MNMKIHDSLRGAPTRSRAFTLIELVVVIAIIATLATLLVAGLNRGVEAGRTIACTSNLRQLALGAALYSLDNKDRLPDFWQWLHVSPGDVTTGKLYPYIQSKAVYLCPTDKLTLDFRRGMSSPPTNSIRASTYAMNCLLCHQNDTWSFVAPARTFLLMEPNLAPHDVSGVVGPVPWMGTSNNTVSSRHNGFGHLLFCDLHVQRVRTAVGETLEKSNRFWLAAPTADTIVLGFATNLPDP
jgi:prepilin-type N-terminal cleavage/methylation domain-containing protein/prepilin-type processing-associated H-X9-DG protein